MTKNRWVFLDFGVKYDMFMTSFVNFAPFFFYSFLSVSLFSVFMFYPFSVCSKAHFDYILYKAIHFLINSRKSCFYFLYCHPCVSTHVFLLSVESVGQQKTAQIHLYIHSIHLVHVGHQC